MLTQGFTPGVSNERFFVISKCILREPVVTEQQQKDLMARAYRRQEELKKLDQADNDEYLKSEWADPDALKRSLGGMKNIRMGPR